jgi:hypothetical protein
MTANTVTVPLTKYTITSRSECIGCGGTKTVIGVNANTCVAVPNQIDGEWLFREWPRIVTEEIAISNYLNKLEILNAGATRCVVIDGSNREFETIRMPTFSSLVKDDIYVIDSKNANSALPSDKSIELDMICTDNLTDIDTWLLVMGPLFQDIRTLADNGICARGDSANVAIQKNSSGKYVVRFFGFDFTSKRNKHQGWSDTITFSQLVKMVRALVESSVYTIVGGRLGYGGEHRLIVGLTQLAIDRDLVGRYAEDVNSTHKQIDKMEETDICSIM